MIIVTGEVRFADGEIGRLTPALRMNIQATRAEAGCARYAYAVDLADRPYAGLVGEAVTAPSGRAWVQIGAEKKTDPDRFAVYVKADAADPDPAEPSLAIDSDGDLRLHGNTTLNGNLTMNQGAIHFAAGPARTAASPWQIYHVEDATTQVHEWRLEMAGGSGGNNRVVIGVWSASPVWSSTSTGPSAARSAGSSRSSAASSAIAVARRYPAARAIRTKSTVSPPGIAWAPDVW